MRNLKRYGVIWLTAAALGIGLSGAPGTARDSGGGDQQFGGGQPFGGQQFGGQQFGGGQPGFQGGVGLGGGLGGGGGLGDAGIGFEEISAEAAFASDAGPAEGVLAPGEHLVAYAFCADLFLAPPDHTAQYEPASGGGRVRFANGQEMTVQEAVRVGALVARGPHRLEATALMGGEILRIHWVNQSPVPVMVALEPGTQLVPGEQKGAAPAPRELAAILQAAQQFGVLESSLTQFAIWAARGATQDDVEQTRLLPISEREAEQVNRILAAASLRQRFERKPDEYPALYEKAQKLLSEDARPFTGSAVLPGGQRVTVEGKYQGAGDALLTMSYGEGKTTLYAGARLFSHRDGRWRARLVHLKSGNRITPDGREIVITPSTGQTIGD